MSSAVTNVLLIVADQWRGDCLGLLDHADVQTPHLDALAEDGVLFRNHFCQSSPCGPARASLLTGLYMHNHRQILNETPLAGGHRTLGHLIGDSGRRPALIGYTDTPNDPTMTGETPPWVCPGFEVDTGFFYDDLFAGWRAWMAARGHDDTTPDHAAAIYLPAGGYDPTRPDAPTAYPAHLTDTAYLFEATAAYISGCGDAPWFLHVNCLKPHPPMVAPAPYNKLYDPEQLALPVRESAAGRTDHPFLNALIASQNLKEYFRRHRHVDDVTPAEDRFVRAAYYGNISEVDTQVGRLIAELKAMGRYDNTLIVFTADHGEQLGDNGIYGRRGPYTGHFHVPLIVRHPDGANGRQVDAYTESVDILPTIADAIGAATGPIDGCSLAPFLAGEAPDNWRRAAYWEQDFRDLIDNPRAAPMLPAVAEECCFAAVLSDAFLYVQFPTLPPLLFDRAGDPACLTNRAGDPAFWHIERDALQALMARRLRHQPQALTEWRQPYGTQQPATRISS